MVNYVEFVQEKPTFNDYGLQTSVSITNINNSLKPIRTRRINSASQQLLNDLLVTTKKFHESQAENSKIHAIIFEENQKKYRTLLRKLKKNHLTDNENKFMEVVDELKRNVKFKAMRELDQSSSDSASPAILGPEKTFSMDIVEEQQYYECNSESYCRDDGSSEDSTMFEEDRFINMVQQDECPPNIDISHQNDDPQTLEENDCLLRMTPDGPLTSNSHHGALNSTFHIKRELFVQESIAKQLLNLLEYGQQETANFLGSFEHIEAERMYTLTNTKKQALKDVLYSGTSALNHSQMTAEITIENLNCFISSDDAIHSDSIRYYALVFRHRDMIYITKMVQSDRSGRINFTGSYSFPKLPCNFKIKAELYVLRIPPPPRGFKTCFSPKTPKLPLMKLIGETCIDIRNMNEERFILQRLDGLLCRPDKFTALVSVRAEWPKVWKGFLIIGTGKSNGQVLWRRQWCVLKGCDISCYTFPCEENYSGSRTIISLLDCVSCSEVKNVYPKKRSLLLQLESFDVKKSIYVTSDTREELNYWRENIDVIIQGIVNWNITNLP